MKRKWHSSTSLLLPAILLLLTSCGDDTPPPEEDSAAQTAGHPSIRYTREYVFLGMLSGAPLVAPFSFLVVDRGGELERVQRAWLAHGGTWDPFLEAQWSSSRTSGVWRVLPHGELRLAAGGPMELESLWFQQRERSLRLNLGGAASSWQQSRDVRFRLLEGLLQLGSEPVPGTVLEILRIDRPRESGSAGSDYDSLFLMSGDTLRLYLSEALGRDTASAQSFGWTVGRDGERLWERTEIRWLEVRQFEQARREIPLRWSFRIPNGGIQGEVQALGYDTSVGAERAGRRAVDVRYTVEGWVEVDGRRAEVMGVVRHSQD